MELKLKNSKIDKYFEFGTTKIKSLLNEKQFEFEGRTIKYILETNKKSGDLIVIFSGIPRPGVRARYNYMRTLKDVKANKLFILDDLGFDERGGYYLGENKDFFMERGSIDLINKVKNELSIDRTIYCGSSKGGWAALFFGIRDNGSSIVAGSLQYLMGTFVSKNERMRENLMKYVMGENFTELDVRFLDDLLKNTLEQNSQNNSDIHLDYSDSEYTYPQYTVHLLEDLKRLGFNFTEDVQHYKTHEELSLYFPPFLLNKVNELLEQNVS